MLAYELPQERIAQRPCFPRDGARLLALDRASKQISHRIFRELPEFLHPRDCLVLNDTKVIPARLHGRRVSATQRGGSASGGDTEGKVELLLLEREGDSTYRCLGKPGRRLRVGTQLQFGARHQNGNGARHRFGEVVSVEGGERIVRFGGPAERILEELGEVPLPPYIRRSAEPEDARWYQTVFAREPGAVAAPTAGLHFTPELLDRIRGLGIRVAFVTLHVGWGTFKPVGEKELAAGKLHPERFSIPAQTLEAIRETKAAGGRVVAVGTTVVRALESWSKTRMGSDPDRKPVGSGPEQLAVVGEPGPDPSYSTTELFIRPGFQFRVVDAMITNFHLPGTGLLYLVAAFAGEERIMAAYQEAIRQGYRFYSYGDAMLIL